MEVAGNLNRLGQGTRGSFIRIGALQKRKTSTLDQSVYTIPPFCPPAEGRSFAKYQDSLGGTRFPLRLGYKMAKYDRP
jgi:hypothetical protein